MYDHLDVLLDMGIGEETRETGASTRYQLTDDDEIAELLYRLDGLVLEQLLENSGQL